MYKNISILTHYFSKFKKMQPNKHPYKFYDIAANLTDNQFGGHYYGKSHHEDDRIEVI